MDYPRVLDEIVTIEKLVAGKYKGLARYGDGDFNIIRGQRDRYHKPCPHLAKALATSLHRGNNAVLNCLIPPTVAREGTLSYQRWVNYTEVNAGIFPFLTDEIYGSSNISRMDSCPHLHTTSWWLQVSELWQDKDICIVNGTDRSLTSGKILESPNPPKSVKHVPCKPQDNFSELEDVYQRIIKADRETVVLCAGLLTRPLVHRLVEAGLYAYDLGHFGMWFKNGLAIPLVDCPK